MSKVMVVPSVCFKHLPTDKLITDLTVMEDVCEVIKQEKQFLERDSLETNPEFRQPIPYVLVTNAQGLLVQMRRCKGQGETRLFGKYYLGAGGHVEEGHTVFYTALLEVAQELGLPLQTLEMKGVLITTGGPVEDVHLCIFYRAVTMYSNFTGPETALHEPQWVPRAALTQTVKDMEKWSQIVSRDFLGITLQNE